MNLITDPLKPTNHHTPRRRQPSTHLSSQHTVVSTKHTRSRNLATASHSMARCRPLRKADLPRTAVRDSIHTATRADLLCPLAATHHTANMANNMANMLVNTLASTLDTTEATLANGSNRKLDSSTQHRTSTSIGRR